GQIVEHVWRRENEPPGEGQYPGIGARAPTARLVAHANAFERNAELRRVAPAGGVKLAMRLALEKVDDAALGERRAACDAKQPSAAAVGSDPHLPTLAAPMHDAVRQAAQRHLHAVRERRRLWQTLEPRRDPAAMLLRELFRLFHAAARRHSENDLAR